MAKSKSALAQQPPTYYSIDAMLDMIEGPNGEACRKIYADHKELFEKVPGSTHNHQHWPGGYIDHVTDAMNVGLKVFELYSSLRPLPFTVSDVLMIVYLHDLEKPFKYVLNSDGAVDKKSDPMDKSQGEALKRKMIADYGIEFTSLQDNALEYVEGIRDHRYRKDARVMGELAVVCHIADLTSARLWYNHPLGTDDPWAGAARRNPDASEITLPSEF